MAIIKIHYPYKQDSVTYSSSITLTDDGDGNEKAQDMFKYLSGLGDRQRIAELKILYDDGQLLLISGTSKEALYEVL